MCVLLPCDGIKDLHFGFHIFTDTKIDQPVKPTKDREKEKRSCAAQKIRDCCYIPTCLV